jgi:hypothetical protein
MVTDNVPLLRPGLCLADVCLNAILLSRLRIDPGRAIPCWNSSKAQLQKVLFVNCVKRSSFGFPGDRPKTRYQLSPRDAHL